MVHLKKESASERQTGVTVTPKSSSRIEQSLLASGKLPDLVVNASKSSSNTPAVPVTVTTTAPPDSVPTEPDSANAELDPTRHDITLDQPTTQDEEDAVDALLSLGSDLSQNLSVDDPLNKNALQMPIGGPTIRDVNPVEVKLDQVSVDNTIANTVEQEQLLEAEHTFQSTSTKPSADVSNNKQSDKHVTLDQKNMPSELRKNGTNDKQLTPEHADSDNTIPATEDRDDMPEGTPKNGEGDLTSTPRKGTVEIKEYSVKRKISDGKCKFKCPKCGMRTKTRKEQNQHYKDSHDPIMCGKCDKLFNNPVSLSIYMYDHMEK